MKTWTGAIGVFLLLAFAGISPAAEWFVATNGNDAAEGTNWAAAKLTIQAAVDAATNGSTVWVSNGTYVGLVTVNKGITVRAVNGAEATTIQGSSSRCVNMSNAAAVVSGFTLTGGTADWGGGAYIDSGALEDCVIRNNTADGRNNLVEQETAYGGGVYGGTLRRCIVAGNLATAYGSQYYRPLAKGGGTYNANLYDCLVVSNEAHSRFGWVAGDVTAGGGVCGGSVWNCTVADNLASLDYLTEAGTLTGGGCYDTALRNSIVYGNMCRYDEGMGWILSNVSGGSATNSCASDIPTGNGNLNDEPLFVDSVSGNYRLATNSPCRDAGNSAFVAGATDLDGNPRIVFGTVDMGAYEFLYQHVAPWGSDGADGISWATAKQTIQAAVDATKNGCIVLVTNGVYATGGRTVGSWALTNRVAIDRPIIVQSVNGPEVTTIQGAGPMGDAAVRCAYLGSNAMLSGFTLSNGMVRLTGDWRHERSGGGAFMEGNSWLTKCRVVANSAGSGGGGGGISGEASHIQNCLVAGNYAEWGSGILADGMEIDSCTVSDNSSFGGPGIVATNSTIRNCIACSNGVNTNWMEIKADSTIVESTCSPGLTGENNVTNDPQFVDAAAGNYRLQATSPCLDAGDDGVVTWAEDLDGNPRIAFGAVDMGAYEAQLTGVDAWFGAITNGQTGDFDCVAGDGVPNLLKYATGGSPRISDDKVRLECPPDGSRPALTFHRNPSATDVRFVVEGTDRLTNGAAWRGLATNVGGLWLGATNVEESGTGNPVECTVTDPVALQSNRFLRLRVTRP